MGVYLCGCDGVIGGEGGGEVVMVLAGEVEVDVDVCVVVERDEGGEAEGLTESRESALLSSESGRACNEGEDGGEGREGSGVVGTGRAFSQVGAAFVKRHLLSSHSLVWARKLTSIFSSCSIICVHDGRSLGFWATVD